MQMIKDKESVVHDLSIFDRAHLDAVCVSFQGSLVISSFEVPQLNGSVL